MRENPEVLVVAALNPGEAVVRAVRRLSRDVLLLESKVFSSLYMFLPMSEFDRSLYTRAIWR